MPLDFIPDLVCPKCHKIGFIKPLGYAELYGCWSCYREIPKAMFNLPLEPEDDGSEEMKD